MNNDSRITRRWTLAPPAALLLCLAGCEQLDTPEPAARAVVVPEHPLALDNPQQDTVTWPLWGGAFAIGELSLRASLETSSAAGLVIAGPGPANERAAIELVFAADGEWTLRETAGGELLQEHTGTITGELVIEVTPTEVHVGELALELTAPLGPRGADAGLYVTLAPGASLTIDELTLSEPLPAHPELGSPLRELASSRGLAGHRKSRRVGSRRDFRRGLGAETKLYRDTTSFRRHRPRRKDQARRREDFSDGLLDIGAALDIWPPLHSLALESLLAEQFSRVAPTELYWPTTRGEDQDFFFLPADLAVNYALVHGQSITGMFLVWDFALPEWVIELHESGDTLALAQVFDEHITATVERYAGRVDTWVVVNEAIWGTADVGEPADFAHTLWYDALGPEYIERAFAVAHAADPEAALIYNETGAELINDKSDFMLALAEDFIARDVPIDGVGLQFHVDAASPPAPDDVIANMQRFAALGLAVHITELDVSLADVDLPEHEARELQADIYADVVEACLAVPACSNVTVFGVSDRHAWDELGDARPLLFDDDYEAKPAFFAVQAALSGSS